MTKRSFIVSFFTGAVVSLVGGLSVGAFYKPLSRLLTNLYNYWARPHGYMEYFDYFATFFIGLPWCLLGLIFGIVIGIRSGDRTMPIAKAAALGYLSVVLAGCFLEGSIRGLLSLWGVVTATSMGIAALLILLGARCGMEIVRLRMRPSKLPSGGITGDHSS